MSASNLASQTVADIATGLPGATAIFRARKLDFCCGGKVPLAEAAAARGIPLEELTAELSALAPAEAAEPQTTEAIIALIQERYHATHRRELPELVRLARRVEAVHRDKPEVPAGLADHLEQMASELESHMQKEEQILFPMMLRGGSPMIAMPIGMMRHEHDDHGEALRALEALTNDHVAPAGACATWRALYAGTRKLADDLVAHIALENNLLFPRFGA